ncbi:MAG: hypothetical protein EAX86_09710 [Candidatus Heimdallarchaeota archaeon]|nr:hypothetical protein [Candidatus Heimdallarchaeota archaeon]
MSQREKEIEKKIALLEGEKKILEGIKAYYEQDLSYNELEEISGISIRELKRYQQDNEYPYRIGANKKAVFEKISNKVNEIDNEIKSLRGSVFGTLDQILFIPSWSKLIGSTFNGFYLNQPVTKINQDNVVFLPDLALTGFEDTTGEPFFLITGLGLYWVKFELGAGSIVTDYREITGILLPLDLYEKAQDETGSVLSSESIRMTEYMVSIPFSLIMAKKTTQMYLRGVLARNVFHPYKECFDQLLSSCQNPNSFKRSEGLKILSGGLSTQRPLYTNELLTEKHLPGYTSLVAGIKNTQPKLQKILGNLQLESTEDAFFEKIERIKSEFREIGRKYLLDWVPSQIS